MLMFQHLKHASEKYAKPHWNPFRKYIFFKNQIYQWRLCNDLNTLHGLMLVYQEAHYVNPNNQPLYTVRVRPIFHTPFPHAIPP